MLMFVYVFINRKILYCTELQQFFTTLITFSYTKFASQFWSIFLFTNFGIEDYSEQ